MAEATQVGVAEVAGRNESCDDGGEGLNGRANKSAQITLVAPCRLVVKATAGARVIGKKGESIKNIRSSTGASVKVLQDELPEALHRRQECIVLTSCGETSALRSALSQVLDRVFDRSGLPDVAERDRDRPYVVDVIVPEKACGLIVGAGGESVKGLIEQLRCDINVVREPLAGIAAQRRVRVLSRERERVDEGVWKLQELLAEFVANESLTPDCFELREALPTDEELERAAFAEKEIPVRVLLAQGEAASVVGRLGANVMRLRDIANVSIDNAPHPFDPTERVCFISKAPLGDKLRVVRIVLGDLFVARAARDEEPRTGLEEGSRPSSMRVMIPADSWNVVDPWLAAIDGTGRNRLSSTNGGSARLVPNPRGSDAAFRVVELNGTEDEVAAGVYKLHQAMEPWEPEDVPARLVPQFRPNTEDGEGGKGKGSGKGGKDSSKGSAKGGARLSLYALAGARNSPSSAAPVQIVAPVGAMLGGPRQPLPKDTCGAELGRLQPVPEEDGQSSHQGTPPVQDEIKDPSPHQGTPPVQDEIQDPSPRGYETRSQEIEQPVGPANNVGTLSSVTQPAICEDVADVPKQKTDPAPEVNNLRQNFDERPRPSSLISTSTVPSPEKMTDSVVAPSTVPPTPVSSHNADSPVSDKSSLLVAVPNGPFAAFLASGESGLASRARVKLNVLASAPGTATSPAVLEVCGTATDIAIASYFIQVQMWLQSNRRCYPVSWG